MPSACDVAEADAGRRQPAAAVAEGAAAGVAKSGAARGWMKTVPFVTPRKPWPADGIGLLPGRPAVFHPATVIVTMNASRRYARRDGDVEHRLTDGPGALPGR